MADRSEYVMRTIEVQHVAGPLGVGRENPPHLLDLRAFVEACSGLPDDLLVKVEQGRPDGTGRKYLTIRTTYVAPVSESEVYWL